MNTAKILIPLLAGMTFALPAAAFELHSTDIHANAKLDEKQVFKGFGCEGGNVSPQLSWSNAPKGTKSFALMVYDPDAPTGSGWWHWVVWNIPATATALPAGAGTADGAQLPAGSVQGRTDFGSAGYGGACPPKGDKPHRYIFTLYALKVDRLDVPENATSALVGFNVRANSLGAASITAKYSR